MAKRDNTSQFLIDPAGPLVNGRAEAGILGSILIDNSHFETVSRRLEIQDFYREEHRIIWRAMCALAPDPLDSITVGAWLKTHSLMRQAKGHAYLSELVTETPASYHVAKYLDIVLRLSALRRLNDVAWRVCVKLRDKPEEQDAEALACEVEGDLSRATEPLRRRGLAHRGLWSPATLWAKMEAEAERARELGTEANRVVIGWPEWDAAIHIPRGLPTFLGARPGVGKSMLALTLRLSAARQGRCSRAYLLEDLADNELRRAIAQLTNLRLDRVRKALADGSRNADWHVCHSAKLEIEQSPLSWDDAHGVTADQLALQIRQAARDGVELVEIDHIGRVQPPTWMRSRKQHEEIAYGLQVLTDVCAETGVAMIIIGHLNRDAAEPGREPRISDIAGTDWIERNARVVLLLHNPEEDMREGREQSGNRLQPLRVRQAKANHGEKNVVLDLVADPTRSILRAMQPVERRALETGQTSKRRMWQVLGQRGPEEDGMPL
jgi:replicative DNA helicase